MLFLEKGFSRKNLGKVGPYPSEEFSKCFEKGFLSKKEILEEDLGGGKCFSEKQHAALAAALNNYPVQPHYPLMGRGLVRSCLP